MSTERSADELLAPEQAEAWRAFMRAHALLIQRLEAGLTAEQVPITWHDVLTQLYQAPGRRLSLPALADRVLLTRTGLTRLLDRIETAGLIERHPSPDDRRRFDVSLTPKGAQTFERVHPGHERRLRELFADALGGPSDARRFTDALRRVVAANEARSEA